MLKRTVLTVLCALSPAMVFADEGYTPDDLAHLQTQISVLKAQKEVEQIKSEIKKIDGADTTLPPVPPEFGTMPPGKSPMDGSVVDPAALAGGRAPFMQGGSPAGMPQAGMNGAMMDGQELLSSDIPALVSIVRSGDLVMARVKVNGHVIPIYVGDTLMILGHEWRVLKIGDNLVMFVDSKKKTMTIGIN